MSQFLHIENCFLPVFFVSLFVCVCSVGVKVRVVGENTLVPNVGSLPPNKGIGALIFVQCQESVKLPKLLKPWMPTDLHSPEKKNPQLCLTCAGKTDPFSFLFIWPVRNSSAEDLQPTTAPPARRTDTASRWIWGGWTCLTRCMILDCWL